MSREGEEAVHEVCKSPKMFSVIMFHLKTSAVYSEYAVVVRSLRTLIVSMNVQQANHPSVYLIVGAVFLGLKASLLLVQSSFHCL